MAPTDDERREVAERLRELGKLAYCPDNTYELMADALDVDDFEGTYELFNRLADLIDPGDTSLSCRDAVACDREALLALADEIDRSALELLKTNGLDPNQKRRAMRLEHAQDLKAASSRICAALGVVE